MRTKGTVRTVLVATLLIIMAFCVVATPASAYNYNRYVADNYAETYALNPNSAYKYFDGADCTNFASQVLFAGGFTETGKYQYWSDYAWYYDWGTRPGYSNTWTIANELYDFLDKSGRADRTSVDHPYYPKFQVGDIIQVDWNNDGYWDHSMVVTGIIISDDDLLMSYHSRNIKNKRLFTIKGENPGAHFGGWHIKNNY
ncbi:MAG: amidase domain-containing protein [Patescibacteria group bacterium]|nr:amidase domain-containing protein [Patescibacteria group bacterium]